MTSGTAAGPVIYVVLAQPRPTGLVRQLMLLLAGVAGQGVRPHLFCIVRSDAEASRMSEAAGQYGLPCEILRERGPLDTGPLRAFLGRVRTRPPSAVQTHGYKPSVYGVLARWRSHVPWIAFYHGRTSTDWKVRAYHALDRELMSLASAVVAVAPGVGSHFARRDRDRIRIVPNGMIPLPTAERTREQVRAELELGPDHRLVGFVGRLSREKGADVFLRTLSRLATPGGSCRGLVVGDGPLRAELETLAAALGLRDRVTFTGQVRDVAGLYGAMDLLLISSRSEVFPNVLLEAVDAGLPVAAAPVGAIPLIAEGIGSVRLADSSEPEALAEAAREAFDAVTPDVAARSRRILRERYSQGARVAALMRVYEGVFA